MANWNRVFRSALLTAALVGASTCASWAKTTVTFFYPVQVGGPLTQVIDGYVEEFEKANPDIDVIPVYSGNYWDTTTKALTADKSGKPPTTAVLLATDVFTFIDEDAVEPFDDFIKSDEDKKWVDGFMPAYLASARVEGKLWCIPFQRSTAVLYWNKKAFKEAGLDPEKYPTTWDEMVEYGKAVVKKDASGRVTRWGVGIPGNVGSSSWLFGALANENGAILVNEAGDKSDLTNKAVVEALQFWVDLSGKYGIHPPGLLEWGTTPSDFLEERIAMIWHTTGNLTNLRKNATFEFGVAPYPAKVRAGSVLGGGNFYIFKKAPDEEKQAAFKFIQYMTSDELLADWAIKTGYVAPRDGSWDTEAMKTYLKEVPEAAVARDQISSSVPEWSTHE
ncbi:MAG: ABC transporter substrate-binding protein, partial [Methylobacteriaceae bacterium]|nr:ABC transporter substrate-binding protein [Methylobacteriaceae bacterium]